MADFQSKRYQIIYADPPWFYEKWKEGDGRTVGKKYPLMVTEDICNLPISSITDNNSILFLWVTWPRLEHGLRVIQSWGFEYKTLGFIWIKTNKNNGNPFWGMGNWTRANSEPCLLATKGKPKRLSASVHQVVFSSLNKHSEKPHLVRDKIVELVGDIPRIELFSRHRIEGWDTWGNELENDIELIDLKEIEK